MSTPKRTPLTDKKACVYLERNGLSIRIEDVNAADAACVALDLLEAMRVLTRYNPELVPDLGSVGGYSPLDTSDHEDYEGRKRAGFRVSDAAPIPASTAPTPRRSRRRRP